MSDQNQNTVATVKARLDSAQNPTDMMSLPEIESNFINTYEAISGRKDGKAHFEVEKAHFVKIISDNKFKNIDRFSMLSAFQDLCISGLTLRDGISYIVPYGKQAVFMPGWKGRLEQINEKPDVIFTHEPQVVRLDDDFDFELGEKPRIIKHRPKMGSTAPLAYVYFIVDFKHGTKTFIMTAAECHNIRNRFSASYKNYIKDCKQAGVAIGETFTKQMQGWDLTIEPPMWITDEIQAFKKTIVKRTYGTLPKLPKQKDLDAKIIDAGTDGVEQDVEDMGGAGWANAEEVSSGPNQGQGQGFDQDAGIF